MRRKGTHGCETHPAHQNDGRARQKQGRATWQGPPRNPGSGARWRQSVKSRPAPASASFSVCRRGCAGRQHASKMVSAGAGQHGVGGEPTASGAARNGVQTCQQYGKPTAAQHGGMAASRPMAGLWGLTPRLQRAKRRPSRASARLQYTLLGKRPSRSTASSTETGAFSRALPAQPQPMPCDAI